MKLQIYKNAKLRETWIGFIEWGEWIVFLPTDQSKPTLVPKPDTTDSGEPVPPAEDSKSEPDE